jgi:polyphosphate kinase 2 (PPK2 family)
VATLQLFRIVVTALERALAARRHDETVQSTPKLPRVRGSVLGKVDLRLGLPRQGYEEQIERCQEQLRDIEYRLYRKRVPVMLVFEGWDAAGKGGAIRRLVQGLDPRGYEVIPYGAPTDVERSHHYLWRFWTRVPKAGHIAIFDRSWYGRVLVERVEGFCSESDWKRAYGEIRETEKQWADAGAVIAKFWLHISPEEQLRRFRERERITYKRWKITAEDWRNRKKWDLYYKAVDEMLSRTSAARAPWTVVEAEDKLHARIKILKTVIARIEDRLD